MSIDYDGLVYGNIAAMLAEGHGAFWRLPFFDADIEAFYDHPPLGVYLQSLLIGFVDHQHVAIRFYVFATMTAFLGALWLLVRAKPFGEARATPYWWIVLVLVAMPTTLRVLSGNYLDGLLATTSMIAIWLGLRAMRTAVIGPAIATALVVYAGLLIKGPVALFPLIALPCILVVGRASIPTALAFGAIAMGTVAVLSIATWFVDTDARTWLQNYWMHQLRASILGERLAENGRGYALARLAMNMGIGMAAALVLAFATGQRRVRWRTETTAWLIVGLSASLPLLLSARHYEHYLMPSLPYLALAIASTVAPMRLPNVRILQVACFVGWASVLAITAINWNSPGDDERLLATVRDIGALDAPGDVVVYCPNQARSFDREVAYLYRDHGRQYRTRLDLVPTGTRFWLACDHVPEGVVELDRTIPPKLRGGFRYVQRL